MRYSLTSPLFSIAIVFLASGSPTLAAARPNGTEAGNLSGYAQTGSAYTSVSAKWHVPGVTFGAVISFTSNLQWIGINGLSGETGVIQGGTGQDIAGDSGVVSYYGWYANAAGGVQTIPADRYPVEPGDVMAASLSCSADCTPGERATWLFVLQDLTRNWTFNQTLRIRSEMKSAEVIEEATSDGNGHTFPWPDYGMITFTDVTTNGVRQNLARSQPLYSSDVTGTSNPSNPNGAGNGFTVCWGPPGEFADCPVTALPDTPGGAN